jgi:uncharacterized Zn finger protein
MTTTTTTRETIDGKARRLLARGCVMVVSCDETHTYAHVRGDTGIYDVNFHGRTWSCTCPAYGPTCSHIYAVRLVTTTQKEAQ